jgi:D-glycero-alpha-D-manno-heptose 1-phosphate guanylyltransferase
MIEPAEVTAVILAGGFGTRVQHLLPSLPKPMAPVCGRPFVEWVVRYLIAQGIQRTVLSTGYLAESVERHFQGHPLPSGKLRCVPERTPLGTAGGFLNAVSGVAEPVAAWLVLNGDSLALAPLAPLIAALNEPEVAGVILGVEVGDAARYGRLVRDGRGRLVRFAEKTPGAGVINAGVYLLRASAVQEFPSSRPLSFERDVFPGLIQSGAVVRVCCAEPPFLDIGTPESLPMAESFIAEHQDCFAR